MTESPEPDPPGPPEPPAGNGTLRLTIKPSPLSWGVGRSRPWARMDGEPATVAWGENVLHLEAGRHRVEVYQLFAGEHAAATAEVDVLPGQEARLAYTAPYHWRSPGRMGPVPPRPSDTWFLYLVAAVLVLTALWALVR